MHSNEEAPRSLLSWRTHCPGCGSKKEKRWGEGRLTLTKFCPNDACRLFGIPNLVAVQRIVTFDRLGRPHVRHKESAIHRRPRFDAPFDPDATGVSA